MPYSLSQDIDAFLLLFDVLSVEDPLRAAFLCKRVFLRGGVESLLAAFENQLAARLTPLCGALESAQDQAFSLKMLELCDYLDVNLGPAEEALAFARLHLKGIGLEFYQFAQLVVQRTLGSQRTILAALARAQTGAGQFQDLGKLFSICFVLQPTKNICSEILRQSVSFHNREPDLPLLTLRQQYDRELSVAQSLPGQLSALYKSQIQGIFQQKVGAIAESQLLGMIKSENYQSLQFLLKRVGGKKALHRTLRIGLSNLANQLTRTRGLFEGLKSIQHTIQSLKRCELRGSKQLVAVADGVLDDLANQQSLVYQQLAELLFQRVDSPSDCLFLKRLASRIASKDVLFQGLKHRLCWQVYFTNSFQFCLKIRGLIEGLAQQFGREGVAPLLKIAESKEIRFVNLGVKVKTMAELVQARLMVLSSETWPHLGEEFLLPKKLNQIRKNILAEYRLKNESQTLVLLDQFSVLELVCVRKKGKFSLTLPLLHASLLFFIEEGVSIPEDLLDCSGSRRVLQAIEEMVELGILKIEESHIKVVANCSKQVRLSPCRWPDIPKSLSAERSVALQAAVMRSVKGGAKDKRAVLQGLQLSPLLFSPSEADVEKVLGRLLSKDYISYSGCSYSFNP